MNRRLYILSAALAVALVLVAYANSLPNSFHFDDSHVIESNLYLRSLSHVPRYFTDAATFSSLPQNATYRPLVTLSLALDYARYVIFVERDSAKRAFRIALPSLLLGIGLLVFLDSMNAPGWKSGGGSLHAYVWTQPFVQWYDTRAVAGYAFVALLVALIFRARAAVAFGLAWFAIALLPTSVFPLAEVANEHRIFLAYIGLVLAASTLVRTRAHASIAVALLLAHAIGTHERNKVWRTEETLWADVVLKSPANGRAWMNYGLTHMAAGRYRASRDTHWPRSVR